MPTWTIEGADKSTGREVVRSIEAPTEELARQEAAATGILVAEVHRSTADPAPAALDYASPAGDKAAHHPSAGALWDPGYVDLPKEALWLRGVAALWQGLSYVLFVLSGLALLAAVLMFATSTEANGISALVVGFSLLISGFGAFTTAFIGRVVATSAVAILDGRRTAPPPGNISRK